MCLESLQDIKQDLIDTYLSDNCKTQKDQERFGCTWVEVDRGYSDRDFAAAQEHAKEEIERAVKEIFNNK